MESKLYNLNYLKELSNGDADFENSMISYFVSNTPEMLDRTQMLIDTEDWAQIREEIHRFIPNLNMVGASALLKGANDIEKFTEKRENLDQVPGLWYTLKEQCVQLVGQLEADLIN